MASPQTESHSATSTEDPQVEIIYVLRNPAMPNYVKIGRTEDLKRRMKELDGTSVPVPFECIYAAKVEKDKCWEQILHEVFSEDRMNPRREFFTSKVAVKAIRILQAVQIEDVTENALVVADPKDESSVIEGQKRIANNENRRTRLDFTMIDISEGAELTFLQNNDVVCTVTQQKPAKVKFEDEKLSLSMAAAKALGKDKSYGVQGAAYWKYEDELLSDRRNRMESEEEENADDE